MRALVLATQNAKKARELEQLAGARFLVRTHGTDVDETGLTFMDNARLKADATLRALAPGVRAETFAVVADDSGIAVDILDGKPGVRSARFASDHGTGTGDDANNALLLLMMAAVPDEMRAARFVSAVCAVIVATGERVEAEGTVEGTIARDLLGAGGFGYDPLFCPLEAPLRRMAELTADEKHAISHRGRAMRALLARLDGPSVFTRARVRPT